MKIGIITHYYKSCNYGGNLQAFALATFLKNKGLDVEQLCFDLFFKRIQNKGYVFFLKRLINFIKNRIFYCVFRKRFSLVQKCLCARNISLLAFNNRVPHSSAKYDLKNIDSANEVYDCFITGSDQVWHPFNFCSAYLLSFVSKGKRKISYAASIAKSDLSEEEKKVFESCLKDYYSISVREKDSAELLSNLCGRNVLCDVDPVFLLSSEEWDSVSSPYKIEKPYLLTYFLGNNKVSRKFAEEYAEKSNLALVSIPYLNGCYRSCDWNFGDEQLFDVGPEHFISLIKNATCVFTDSFHASAFSIIQKSNFFVFSRDETNSIDMSNRIVSLLDLYDCSDRFVSKKENMNFEYVKKMGKCPIINTDYAQKRILESKKNLLRALES